MRVRFLLGPAGSGKTLRCLTEVRQELTAAPEGRPLLLLTPKQTTYQLERQLLAHPSLPGYTRLHILSFERLAYFILDRIGHGAPQMLDEEGRLMVLRGLLARKRDDLKLFRASARLTGFAQELSLVLRELQRHQFTPQTLLQLAAQISEPLSLVYKLQDLAVLLREYLDWLTAHRLQDADCLLNAATDALLKTAQASPLASPGNDRQAGPGEAIAGTVAPGRRRGSRADTRKPISNRQLELGFPLAPIGASAPPPALGFGQLWVDGFVEWSPQELDLLAALVPRCEQATLTFCLETVPAEKKSWLSAWSVVTHGFETCRQRLEHLPGVTIQTETMPRSATESRFRNNSVLAHLEKHWAQPLPFPPASPETTPLAPSLRVVICPDPEAEVTLAAREILRFARAGGRYREITVLVRQLEGYHEPLQRLFARYGIPFFLDRRESVSHHPLAELTRSALRTVVFQWAHEDWFAALKTGLVPAEEGEIDRLENEALARGWQGAAWQRPIVVAEEPELSAWLAELQPRLLPPFQRLALAMGTCHNQPTGPQLTAALRDFWQALDVERRLEDWAAADLSPLGTRFASSVHATVWEQMNAWLENVELAFPTEALSLREWLPILEAGLANLTVGVIPPALDQVLIGALDRSRNPDVRFALVLGMNEGVFPAPPAAPALLSEADRLELERRSVNLGPTSRRHLGRERFYAYLACTRARERVVFTCVQHDSRGALRNPSPFLSQLCQLFPELVFERAPRTPDWRESEHPSELILPLLRAQSATDAAPITLPSLAEVMATWRQYAHPAENETLAPGLADALYGPVLRTSVSRMEQFAACPFKFFVHSGLRAEERLRFELDRKEQGNYQHDVLAFFHEQLRTEHKQWRDITPAEARERIGSIARMLVTSYRDGLLQASEESRFLARVMTESLQDFAATLVEWMGRQYQFDPVAVELPFGDVGGASPGAPAWTLDLDGKHRLELNGRIDRVDLWRRPGTEEALCVVVDYKSSQKHLDNLSLEHGLQLQLLAYLNVLCRWPNPRELLGVSRLVPAGVFYVNLHGKYTRAGNRRDALADAEQARKLAYRHSGRFDAQALPQLDARTDVRTGDQFNYRLTNQGQVHKGSREALATTEFLALLEAVEANLRRMGHAVFSGQTSVDPFRKGTAVTACMQCSYRAICRIDPWTHRFRVLRKQTENNNAPAATEG